MSMVAVSKNSYLDFNNIWQRKKGYEAHRRRLSNVKGSNYQNKNDSELLEELVQHQIKCNQKKDRMRKQKILFNNGLIVRRLIEITQKQSPKQESPMSQQGGQKTFKKYLQDKELYEENQKFHRRITSVQPHFNFKSFDSDYQQHQYYKHNMQKFTSHQNQVKLKALISINEYEQSISSKFKEDKHRYKSEHKSKTKKQKHLEESIDHSKNISYDNILPFLPHTVQFYCLQQTKAKNLDRYKFDLLTSPTQRLNKTLFGMLSVFDNKSMANRSFDYDEPIPQHPMEKKQQQTKQNNQISRDHSVEQVKTKQSEFLSENPIKLLSRSTENRKFNHRLIYEN